MGARGRKSAAALGVIDGNGIRAVKRPKPLDVLTDEQAKEWLIVVNSLPADWFPKETHGMLAQYCRHVVSARRISQLIETHIAEATKAEAGEVDRWLNDYDRLLKMQEREGRALSSLATRMRLSQQSQYSKDKSKGKPRGNPLHMS